MQDIVNILRCSHLDSRTAAGPQYCALESLQNAAAKTSLESDPITVLLVSEHEVDQELRFEDIKENMKHYITLKMCRGHGKTLKTLAPLVPYLYTRRGQSRV